MKNIYFNLKWIPEFYFILVAILWYYISVHSQDNVSEHFVNFPAIIMIVVFHIQLFLNDQVVGKVLALITSIATLYLVFLLGNDIYGFLLAGENDYLHILKLGNLILLNFIMAYSMYIKYNGVAVEQLNN